MPKPAKIPASDAIVTHMGKIALDLQDNFISDCGRIASLSLTHRGVTWKLGYEVIAFYHCGIDPAYYFTKAHLREMQKAYEQIRKDFCTIHGLYKKYGIPENLQIKYSTYQRENEGFKIARLRLNIEYVPLAATQFVHIALTLSYGDAPYYSGYDEMIFDRTYKPDYFLSKDSRYWEKLLRKAIKKLK